MFVADLGALAADPSRASATRCRAVLRAGERVQQWLAIRLDLWQQRLAVAETAESVASPRGSFSRAIVDPDLEDLPRAS